MRGQKRLIRNAAVMFAAIIITKLLGALLKIPLGNILGGRGMGCFTAAYSVFTPVLVFVCSGIPTLLTRSAAAYFAEGRSCELAALRKCSLLLAAALGALGTAAVIIVSLPFAYFIAGTPESLPCMLIIAPAVFFCSVTAVYRGYHEGLSDTLPTAVSQVIEASVKTLLGIGLSYLVYSNGRALFGSSERALPYAAAAAVLGVTVSELCGMVYMLLTAKKRFTPAPASKKPDKAEILSLCRKIFLDSLPISLGCAAATLISLADMMTIPNCVELSVKLFGAGLPNGGTEGGAGNFMYGCYAGIVMSVYMLVSSASGIIGRCMMPKLAFSVSSGNAPAVRRDLKLLIKGTAVVTAPLSLLTAALASPLLRLLYPMRALEAEISTAPLIILCMGGTAAALTGAAFTVFNANGDFICPIKLSLMGGAVKLILNAALIPFLNVSGAALSAVCADILCLICAQRAAKKKLGLDLHVVGCSLTAFFAAATGGACAAYFYGGFSAAMSSFAALAASAGLGLVLYAVILLISDSRDFAAVLKLLFADKRAALSR